MIILKAKYKNVSTLIINFDIFIYFCKNILTKIFHNIKTIKQHIKWKLIKNKKFTTKNVLTDYYTINFFQIVFKLFSIFLQINLFMQNIIVICFEINCFVLKSKNKNVIEFILTTELQ